MRIAVAAGFLLALFGCAQPGTPIPQHRTRGLPEGFPEDIPLHIDFSIVKSYASEDAKFFAVKMTTSLELYEIHYFFHTQLTGRGYSLEQQSSGPKGGGIMVFENENRRIEVTIGTEMGKRTILLRLKIKRTEGREP